MINKKLIKTFVLLMFIYLYIPIVRAEVSAPVAIPVKISQMESNLHELITRLEDLQRQQFVLLQEMREQLGEIDRLRNPGLYAPVDRVSVLSDDMVRFETCGEDRFNRVIPVPAEKKLKLIQNGDFENGLNGWEICNGVDFANSIWNCQLVYDEDKGSKVIQFERSESKNDGSAVGIYQDVFIDMLNYKDVRIKLDVKPMYQSLSGGGMAGGEYPTNVQIAFIDQHDKPHVWTHGFYYEGENAYSCAEQIGQDKWFTYTSPNLKDVLPDCADEKRNAEKALWPLVTHEYAPPVIPKYIVRVLVFGSGWDFRGRADNIEFVLTPK